jgi:hypothetical protein
MTVPNTDKWRLNDRFLKRSAKLIPCQIEMVGYWRGRGLTYQAIADMFKVSRRLIYFICHPEKAAAAKAQRAARKYDYGKEYRVKAVQEHRKFKKNLNGKQGN